MPEWLRLQNCTCDSVELLGGIAIASAPVNPIESKAHWDGDGITGPPRIVIDLSDQQANFYKGELLVGVSPISSGTASHPTPTGHFNVTQKSPNHRSSLYGDYVDSAGNVVVKEIDNRKDKRPPGTRYLGADMGFFMRFNGPIGMRRGFLPGYPASHGCIRLPERMAEVYYENASIGTPCHRSALSDPGTRLMSVAPPPSITSQISRFRLRSRLGIILGSALSAISGYLVLRFTTAPTVKTASD